MDLPPGNSNKAKAPKPERKKLDPIITTTVIIKKKPLSSKFKEIFVGDDAKSVMSYVIGDVVIPSIRNLIFDSITKGTGRMMYGDRAPNRSPMFGNGGGTSRISYSNPVRRDPRDVARSVRPASYRPDQPARRSREDVIFTSRDEAEHVLERMHDVLDLQGYTSVGDLYDLIGQESDYTLEKWGWTNLTGISIRQTRDGYLIDFPQPEPIG